MRVFDAAPLVAVLLGEPGGLAVRDALTDQTDRAISAVNAAEVIDTVARLARATHRDVMSQVDLWIDDGLAVEQLDWPTVSRAAEIRSTHYHRARIPVSLADCCGLALAERFDAELVTSDGPLARVAQKLGVAVLPVPNSTGVLPE